MTVTFIKSAAYILIIVPAEIPQNSMTNDESLFANAFRVANRWVRAHVEGCLIQLDVGGFKRKQC